MRLFEWVKTYNSHLHKEWLKLNESPITIKLLRGEKLKHEQMNKTTR